MKKISLLCITILLMAVLFTGCGGSRDKDFTSTEPNSKEEAQVTTEAPTETSDTTTEADEEDIVYEGDASSYYIDVVYGEQIDRYYTALSEKWSKEKYTDNGLSNQLIDYYEGNPLNNVGFGFEDLNGDGHWELIIGAISGAEENPAVFEIWTLVDDKPVMVCQSDEKNHYALQYVQEDLAWYVAKEVSDNKDKYGTYYLLVSEDKLEVMQGIIYDAAADGKNPWFMTYDLDGDVSNDDTIDEETAKGILESNRNHYIAMEYFPYILYK